MKADQFTTRRDGLLKLDDDSAAAHPALLDLETSEDTIEKPVPAAVNVIGQPKPLPATARTLHRPPQGATVSDAGVHYRIWAPEAQRVAVEVWTPDGEVARSLPLAPSGGGFFHGLDAAGRRGDRYKVRLNAEIPLPDPAARWQPEGVHGPSMVVDPETYQWADGEWHRPDFRDLAIYEIHIGTFTPQGTFLSAMERLKEIRELGINAIEIMPVGEFAGGRNWGYDGTYWFAPSHQYGHPDDLRALVDAAHGVGLAVILDVVYNHLGPDGNYLHAYIGEYLNEAEKTPWGGAIRYGSPNYQPLRALVVSNPGYWMEEFHIDGFRFDATHAIVDDSPRHILQELTAEIRERGGYAIAEDSQNEAKLMMPEEEGGMGFDAVWADDFHHSVRVANTGENEAYLADFSGSLQETIDTLRHGWEYRGQFSKAMGAPRGTLCQHLPPRAFVHCISNHDQTGNHAFGERLSHRALPPALRAADALLCLTPYTPMVFMGQEWAATTPFLFFTDHKPELGELIIQGRRDEFKHFSAFSAPEVLDRIPNPQKLATFEASKLIWAERERARHAGSLELYRACLTLRASEPAFRPATRETWEVHELAMGIGAIAFRAETCDWVLLFDLTGGHEGNLQEEAIFQNRDRTWKVVLSTDEERFGGRGEVAVDVQTLKCRFPRAQTVLLRSEKSRGV